VVSASASFTGPQYYNDCLGPVWFDHFAADLVRRLPERPPGDVLEIACGTGIVTRRLRERLGASLRLVATDLSRTMLDYARAKLGGKGIEWREADAMKLPFADGAFGAVVCGFGLMFVPDRQAALAEARRTLADGGTLLFNVWDRIEENECANIVTESLRALFADDPPLFLRRTPHGYFDVQTIHRDLVAGGFTASPRIATVAERSHAPSPQVPAIAYCQGTPLRSEITARGPSRLGEATEAAAEALARRFGRGAVDGKIQAHVVSIAS